MQIGEMAKTGGVSVQTVRFYERQGLLPDPERKDSGYREYGEADLKRLLLSDKPRLLVFTSKKFGRFSKCARVD
jgi:DNA-binding transcriptional MerR regulator